MNIRIKLSLIICMSCNAHGDFTHTGEDQEDGTGLSYNRARYYDAEIGSFVSRDPIGISGGLNVFQYCLSNPINNTDPLGDKPVPVIIVNPSADKGAGSSFRLAGQYAANNFGYKAIELAKGDGVNAAAVALSNFKKTSGDTISFLAILDHGHAGSQSFGVDILSAANIGKLTSQTQPNAAFCALGCNVGAITSGPGLGQTTPTGATYLQSLANASNRTVFGNTGTTGVNDLTGQFYFNIKPGGNSLIRVPDGVPVGFGPNGQDPSNTGVPKNIALPGRKETGHNSPFFDYFNQSGVLIDKAATLVETNLADIKGATYDPVSKQIVFLGSNNTPGVDGIDMDYFFTAVNSVYGSAAPPSVSLDAPASAASLWQDYGDGDGIYEAGEWGGCSLRYNPLWSGEDTNVKVRIKCTVSGINYDFAANFAPQTVDWLQFPNGEYPMHLVFTGTSGTAPPGIGVWGAPFASLANGATFVPNVSTSQTVNGGQDWTYPFQIYNGGTATMTNFSFAVIPDRQHRRFGGRLENTKLGWVLQEADRIMKCQAIGKDNTEGIIPSFTRGLYRLIRKPASSPAQFYLYDRLGSIRFLAVPAANVTKTLGYDPFGAQQ